MRRRIRDCPLSKTSWLPLIKRRRSQDNKGLIQRENVASSGTAAKERVIDNTVLMKTLIESYTFIKQS